MTTSATPLPGEEPDPGSDATDGPDDDAPRRCWRRRRLALLTVAVVLLGCLPFVWVLTSTGGQRHTVDSVPDRPVAIVLGAGVRPDGLPSYLLAQRLDLAVELYEAGSVQAVLVTGDNGAEHYNETDTMRDYVVAAGVPEERVVGDHAGFSTWDSCARANEVFGVAEATVVTQEFHLPRAVRLCRAAGIDAVGVGGASMDQRAVATVYGWVREVPAAVAALGTVVFRPDPRFLGDYETGVDDALAAARTP
ncbi:vancomycin high temperature exclusion protein [Nocardiopsis sp. NPDC058789]|uniref:SanA/YdcF family protein n=1 Tax=Nocardiopsis sp. NPDC058789 TaxID=3346634 RepID=UPI00366C0EF2